MSAAYCCYSLIKFVTGSVCFPYRIYIIYLMSLELFIYLKLASLIVIVLMLNKNETFELF